MLSKLCPKLLRLRVSGCAELTDLSIVAVAEKCREIEVLDVGIRYYVSQITDSAIFAIASCCPVLSILNT
jgi:hypothetical protein